MINNVQNLNGPGNLDSGINPALGGAGFTGGGSGIKFEPIYGSLESPGGAPLIDIGVIDERRGLSPDGPPPIDIGVIDERPGLSPGGAPLIDIGVIDERRGLSPDGPPPIDIGVINDQLFQDQTNR